MPKNNPLPNSHHFARHCRPDTVEDGLPTGRSFQIRPIEKKKGIGISVNWLEYFSQGDVCENLEKVRVILKRKNYNLSEGGRFAVLNVGYCQKKIKLAHKIDISIKHTPNKKDPSHSTIFSENLAIYIEIAELVTSADVYPAIVTASDVVDRETLKAFVLAAKAHADNATSLAEYLKVLQEFGTEGAWKQGSIYLFVATTDGIIVLHGANPDLKDQNLIDLKDANGVKIVQELVATAAEGGYVEYLWPNPQIEGDTGSPKVSYAIPYSAHGQDFVLGAGFYPAPASTAVAD